jgi:hypothetical protein
MISTDRVEEFTFGATVIPRRTAPWGPSKVSSLGLTVGVTPGTLDVAERVTRLVPALVSSWFITTV